MIQVFSDNEKTFKSDARLPTPMNRLRTHTHRKSSNNSLKMKTKPTYKESSSNSDSPCFADNEKSVRKTQRDKAKRESRQARRRREIEREWNHKTTFAYLNKRAAYWMERALKAETKLKEREVTENELAERELAESLHRALCGNSRSPSPSSLPSVTSELPLHTVHRKQ